MNLRRINLDNSREINFNNCDTRFIPNKNKRMTIECGRFCTSIHNLVKSRYDYFLIPDKSMFITNDFFDSQSLNWDKKTLIFHCLDFNLTKKFENWYTLVWVPEYNKYTFIYTAKFV